ncbi:MAG TPA: hypothetical protein PLX89_05515 [Verrucomicrobiota bacterium]|nr:hypothetical protein [Verrucomicrobiota bacterium]
MSIHLILIGLLFAAFIAIINASHIVSDMEQIALRIIAAIGAFLILAGLLFIVHMKCPACAHRLSSPLEFMSIADIVRKRFPAKFTHCPACGVSFDIAPAERRTNR